jgi:malonate transporter
MNSIAYSANVIIPVFLLIILGMVAHKKNLIDNNFITVSNRVVFTMALPSSLFSIIYKSDFVSLFDPLLLVVTCGGALVGFVISWVLSKPFCYSDDQRGVFIQGSLRGNIAIFGMAILTRAISPEVAAVGAGLLVFLIPLYNFFSVIALTGWNQTGDRKERLKKQALNILMNPLMIAIALGVIFSLFKIGLPNIMDTTLTYLARMTAPLALLGIGGTLKLSGLRKRLKPTISAGTFKLIFMPILVVGLGLLAGMRGEILAVLLVMSGSPTAVSSFAMADALKNDAELAADVITTSTLFSIITIGGGLALLKALGVL